MGGGFSILNLEISQNDFKKFKEFPILKMFSASIFEIIVGTSANII